MQFTVLISDQLLTWSANGRYSVVYLAQAPRAFVEANARFGDAFARLAYRTLQTLWQTWMPVCERPRPWSQALSIRELPGTAAANGLCAASRLRGRHRTPGQLPPRSRDSRGGLRDQSRTITPPRGALRCGGEPGIASGHRLHRSATGRRAHRQHARSLALRRGRAGTE